MPLSDREPIQALAYLLVTFGHPTDRTLSMEEM